MSGVAAASSDLIGQQLGNYQVVRKLGGGGMGDVFEATHVAIGKRVAIKTIRSDRNTSGEMVARFFNEARATSDIRHPGIIEVFDFGRAGHVSFLVMELLQGETLRERLDRERQLALPLCLAILRQVASALAAAHERGIVHRDLKPDNIFLVPYPDLPGGVQAKVLDFGIAKLYGDSDDAGATAPSAPRHELSVTATGAMMGTPLYMSPEHWHDAGRADQRSDIYSLGCIAFEMLAGRPPYLARTLPEIAHAHFSGELPRVTDARFDTPPSLASLVAEMLAKEPDARPKRMQDVTSRLEAVAKPVGDRELITHLRVATLLAERCKALNDADQSTANRIGEKLLEISLKNTYLNDVVKDRRHLRRGELSQLLPEIRGHLESAYRQLLAQGRRIEAYEKTRSTPMTIELAERASKMLVDARPDIDWDEIRRAEDAASADAGSIGASTAQKLIFSLMLTAVVIAIIVVVYSLARSSS